MALNDKPCSKFQNIQTYFMKKVFLIIYLFAMIHCLKAQGQTDSTGKLKTNAAKPSQSYPIIDSTKLKLSKTITDSANSSSKSTDIATSKSKSKKDSTTTASSNDYGWQDRFALFVGGGVGLTAGKLYNDPVVNPTNNIVEIENYQKLRTSLTLGIVFTPIIHDIFRTVHISDEQGKTVDSAKFIMHVPVGISFALFLNPISLTKLNDNSFTNSVDLGLGCGYRYGDWLFMATADFFSIRQPRQYFVDEYKDQNKPFVINGQTQTTIDVANNNIFRNTLVASFGVKICYAFSLAKSFYANSQQLTK